MSEEIIKIPENVMLEIITGPDKGRTYKIDSKSITIGREENCELSLKDEFISHKQCQIVFRKEHFTVIDLGSLNKTKVNNTTYVQKNLADKDIISIGKTMIKFNWEGSIAPDSSEDQIDEADQSTEINSET